MPSPAHSRDHVALPALVLFDIDGTLVRRSGPHHRLALEHAVEVVAGRRVSTEGIPTHGMLDTDIVTHMYARAGLSPSRAKREMPRILHAAEERYLVHCPPSLKRKTCPGARVLLQRLQRRAIPMLLVTGNFPRIGWRKLQLAGVDSFFRDGAFAGMSPTRAGLARRAAAHARKQGWASRNGAVWLIGDSPNDILAARENGMHAIAVSTGISTHEELAALAPDLLLRSLAELQLPRPARFSS